VLLPCGIVDYSADAISVHGILIVFLSFWLFRVVLNEMMDDLTLSCRVGLALAMEILIWNRMLEVLLEFLLRLKFLVDCNFETYFKHLKHL